MKEALRFLLVDDDRLNNLISQTVISRVIEKPDIKTFTEPEKALLYIETDNEKKPVVLFLDINMPTMTGWEFLEQFENFTEEIKHRYKIFILSSSVDDRDKERAIQNSHVLEYIEKPLRTERMKAVMEKHLS